MVSAYRQKYGIESAFREMKSVLKLRPWFVYKMQHVRAHYTICILAYLLEKTLDLKLESLGLKNEGWTLGQLKTELARFRLIEFEVAEKHKSRTLQKMTPELTSILKRLNLQKALKWKPTPKN